MKEHFFKFSFFYSSVITIAGVIIAAIIWAKYNTMQSAVIGTLIGAVICFLGGYLSYCSQKHKETIRDKIIDKKIDDAKTVWE